MTIAGEYTEDEWASIADSAPLASLDSNEAYNLHRYWLWVDYQRSLFYWLIDNDSPPPAADFLMSKRSCAMYLWYAMLWSLLEGFEQRGIELPGLLAEDAEYLGDRLRRCRNAVFHVPRDGQWDGRLFEPLTDPNSPDEPDREWVPRVRRLTEGLGRLFLEELRRRGLTEE